MTEPKPQLEISPYIGQTLTISDREEAKLWSIPDHLLNKEAKIIGVSSGSKQFFVEFDDNRDTTGKSRFGLPFKACLVEGKRIYSTSITTTAGKEVPHGR